MMGSTVVRRVVDVVGAIFALVWWCGVSGLKVAVTYVVVVVVFGSVWWWEGKGWGGQGLGNSGVGRKADWPRWSE